MRGNHNTDIPRPEYPRPDFQRGTSEGIDWNLSEWSMGIRF